MARQATLGFGAFHIFTFKSQSRTWFHRRVTGSPTSEVVTGAVVKVWGGVELLRRLAEPRSLTFTAMHSVSVSAGAVPTV